MKTSDITDQQFLQAVEAIDSGNIDELEKIIFVHPRLVKERLRTTGKGYFKDPYLIWFVADNPTRNNKLPANIEGVIRLLVQAIKQAAPDTYQYQIDYTLKLVATGRTPRECGVQIAMMDLLIDAGAMPDDGVGALAQGNTKAAQHLINRGGKLTLVTAVCLERMDDIHRLSIAANAGDKVTALTAASFYGKVDMMKFLLMMGADPNGYPDSKSGFHSHATPLHQAVSSGSLAAVKLLVEAGAKTDALDKIYCGTPLGWAVHMQTSDHDRKRKTNFAEIEAYLMKAL